MCKDETGDSIEYATPAIASAALTRLQPTISPEESIARLISSKAACTRSPSTESAFKIKSSLKRLRTVTHSEINAVVCGIAETRHAHVPPSALSVPTGIAITSETVETSKEPDAKKCAAASYSAPPAIPEIEESTKIHVSLTSCHVSVPSSGSHKTPFPCLASMLALLALIYNLHRMHSILMTFFFLILTAKGSSVHTLSRIDEEIQFFEACLGVTVQGTG